MTSERARRARTTVAVAVSVALAIAAHFAIVQDLPAHAGALLSLVPLTILMVGMARRSSRPQAGFAVLGLAALAAWLAFPTLKTHFPNLFFLEHAGGQLILAVMFGRTLAEGQEPLVARFARIIHGYLPPVVAAYCRSVTVAWTTFFCVLFVLSCGLYLGGFLAAWSILANILSPILVGTMFVLEIAIRRRVLPADWEHVGLARSVHAFSRHFAGAQPQSPR